MKIDTSKDGLSKYFRSHEIMILQILWEKTGVIHTSRGIWRALNERLQGETISRATVINFLESVSEIGLVDKKTETCRGGKRGLYSIQRTEIEFRKLLLTMLYKDIVSDYYEYFGKFPELGFK